MKKSKGLKVRVERSQLEALRDVYRYWADRFDAEGEYEKLLYEHLMAFYQRLEGLVEREQFHFTIAMSDCEAMAFMQTWALLAPTDNFTMVIIHNVLGQIDQRVHKNKILSYGR